MVWCFTGIHVSRHGRAGLVAHLSLAAWEARLEVQSDGLCEKIAAIWVKMLPCWLLLETGMMVGGGGGRRRE